MFKKKKKEVIKETKKFTQEQNNPIINEKQIEERLRKCFDNFIKLQNIGEFYVTNFKEYDILDGFDLMGLYDFEIMVEDEFFNGEDIMPDGKISKIKDFIEFIKNNME